MSLADNIEGFIGIYRDLAQQIEALRGERDPYVRVCEKTLHASLIDGLARAASAPGTRNKDRFIYVVQQFGEWHHSNHVSLPHLVGLLAKVPDPQFDTVRTFARAELAKWMDHGKIDLRRDPTFDHVKSLWPRSKLNQPVHATIRLVNLKHVQLLYTYRNGLVHELRPPGYGMEPIADESPYYTTMSTRGGQAWELNYPIRFFRRLSTKILNNLEAHLKANQIDPLSSYQFGSHWLPDLN